jgi:glycine cleavage system aminomethyltransferase T
MWPLGAKMVGFGGWNMPLQYESILAEWEYNRKTVSFLIVPTWVSL